MDHIGIDLGAGRSHLVTLSSTGEVKERGAVSTLELRQWLEQRPPSHVVMEACTQSSAIARAATAAGHATKVVAGNLVRMLGVGQRGIKTDQRDAEALARASLCNPNLPSVHMRSDLSAERRNLLLARFTLVKTRRMVSVSIKSWARGQLLVVRGRARTNTFGQRLREAALNRPEGLPHSIEVLLQTYEQLSEQIEQLDREISELAAQDPACAKLQTISGVGPVVSLAFTTHLDTPDRFKSSDDLASYLALIPGENTTGGKIKRTGAIVAGPSYLKALLVQAAWSMWRTKPRDPVVLWARALADRRGVRVAIIALARKIATVMWSMWKHGTSYDPSRASSMRASVEDLALQGRGA